MSGLMTIALCGVGTAVSNRIADWLDEHPALRIQVAFATTDTDSLLERLAHESVHGVVLDANLGLEGLSFAQELMAAGYEAICLTGVGERSHLRKRAEELGLAICPDAEPARLAAVLRKLLGSANGGTGEGQIITFHSPRGGAGASTLLLQLARNLSDRGRSVVLVEVGGGGSALPLLGLRPGGGWADLLPYLEDDLVGSPDGPTLLSRALVEVAPGFHLLPSGGPALMDEVSTDQVESVLQLLPACGFSHILVDTPAEMTLLTAVSLAASHAICLICTPDPVSTFRLLQVQEVLSGLQIPPGRVQPVINRVKDALPRHLSEVLQFLRYRSPLRIPEESKPPLDAATGFVGFRMGGTAAKAMEQLLDFILVEVSDA